MINSIYPMRIKVTLILVSSLILSCSSDEPTYQTKVENEGGLAFKTKELTNQVIYNIECKGQCANGRPCLFTIAPPFTSGECNCEECVLEVTLKSQTIYEELNQEEVLHQMLSRDIFYTELVDFVTFKYKDDAFGIHSIEYGIYKESYYLLYKIIVSNDINESVMFVYQFNGRENEPKKYRIDCHGSCDTPGETCRERYIFNPPSVECTCESDNCVMDIIEL